MEIKINSKVRQQLAHCFYQHGENPDELMYKLESLILEWFSKGVSIGIENERKHKSELA